LALLVLGLGVIAQLVTKIGPRLLLRMVARIGWRFAVIVAIYALHVCLRAVAPLPTGTNPLSADACVGP